MVFAVEVLADARDLTKLELGEAQAAPALGGAHQGTEHQLQNRLLAEAVRNDLQPTPLLDEETLEEVGGPDRSAVRDWQAQMRNAGFEVVLEPKTAKMLVGRLPIDKLAALAQLEAVRYVAPQT